MVIIRNPIKNHFVCVLIKLNNENRQKRVIISNLKCESITTQININRQVFDEMIGKSYISTKYVNTCLNRKLTRKRLYLNNQGRRKKNKYEKELIKI